MKTLIDLDIVRDDLLLLNANVLENARLGRIDILDTHYVWDLSMATYNLSKQGIHKETSTFYNYEIIRLARFVNWYLGRFDTYHPRWQKYINLLQ